MLNSFILSFKLKYTYKTNGIIYSLKSTPLIKRLLPSSLYASSGLKKLANILSIILEIVSIFFGKLLYMLLMIFLALNWMKNTNPDGFIHLFFFLTIIGCLLNTKLFDPTKDKYYAMFLMRMDAKEYTLSNYYHFLIKMAVGFVPFTIYFGLMSGVSLVICLIMPLFVVSMKLISASLVLFRYKKKGRVKNENLPSPGIIAAVVMLLAFAYLPPVFGYAINTAIFAVVCGVCLIISVFSLSYIRKFDEYRSVYKDLLSPKNIVFHSQTTTANTTKSYYLKKIDISSDNTTSKKTGYALIHDLFIKRHSRLLAKSVKRITICVLIVFVASIAAIMILPNIKNGINELMITSLPYFLFVMYFINRGKVITQAMFMNCDHSMLTYRFYRQPKAILSLFTARLKYIILINLIPAVLIAIGMPLLLFITGGTPNPLNYILLLTSIITMSVFFSVHNIMLYYLLQPYNVNLEMKNATFMIANSVTYLICYFAIYQKIPTLIFGSLITVFCILYVIVALFLAYKLAPRTFKLRG